MLKRHGRFIEVKLAHGRPAWIEEGAAIDFIVPHETVFGNSVLVLRTGIKIEVAHLPEELVKWLQPKGRRT